MTDISVTLQVVCQYRMSLQRRFGAVLHVYVMMLVPFHRHNGVCDGCIGNTYPSRFRSAILLVDSCTRAYIIPPASSSPGTIILPPIHVVDDGSKRPSIIKIQNSVIFYFFQEGGHVPSCAGDMDLVAAVAITHHHDAVVQVAVCSVVEFDVNTKRAGGSWPGGQLVNQLKTDPVIPGHGTKHVDVVLISTFDVHVPVKLPLENGPTATSHVAVHTRIISSLYRDRVNAVGPSPVVVVILAVYNTYD
jgi:hypothetical protein